MSTPKRTTKAQAEKQEWIEKLKAELPKGSKVYTVLRHCAPSGMSRRIDVYHFTCEGAEIHKSWLSFWVSKATGFSFNQKHECLNVSGCGMDMGFHVVETLSRVLYGESYALKQEWL